MNYKVSVIIPTYNSEKYLPTTIQSVINQSIGFENIELIMIDDFSTDNTQTIIAEYVSKYSNIKTYELGQKSGSPGASRNLGIKNSNGKYLMFLDHDDCYKKDAVEKLYNEIENNNADVTIGKFKTFGDGEAISDFWLQENIVLNSISENTLFLSIDNIWRMIFPKKFILDNNIVFPENVFAEDLTFMIDSFINANKIIFINDIVYNFRLQKGEISSTSLSKGFHYLNGLIDGYYYTMKVLEKHDKCEFYDKIFNQHLSTWLSDLIASETISLKEKQKLLKKSEYLYKKIKIIAPYPENIENLELMKIIKEKGSEELYNLIKEPDKIAIEHKIQVKNSEIAYLKTTKGWFKYKMKNIIERLKNKF